MDYAEDMLRRAPLFEALDEEGTKALQAGVTEVMLARGDRLFGEGGDDRLFGGESRDILRGGPGTDTDTGGNNGDVCAGERFHGCRTQDSPG